MKRIALLALALAGLAAAPAFAQSTATPVVTGYLTTSGCAYGQTTCFVQFGAGGGAVTVTPNPSTHVQCAVLCTSLVVKAATGTLQSFAVSADATLQGAAWWLLVYDATTKPTDGTVTPAKCYAYPTGTASAGGTLTESGVTFATGITMAVSTTGCFTSTSSTHAFLAGDYR